MNIAQISSEFQRLQNLLDNIEDDAYVTQALTDELDKLTELSEDKVDGWATFFACLKNRKEFLKAQVEELQKAMRSLQVIEDSSKEYLVALHERGSIPAKLTGKTHTLSVQESPWSISHTLIDEELELLSKTPWVEKTLVPVYKLNKDRILLDKDKPDVQDLFTVSKNKHIRIRVRTK